MTLFQLTLTWILSQYVSVFWSSFLAYTISGQFSFLLHSVFSWSDRHPNMPLSWKLMRLHAWRWCKFMLVNASAASLNGFVQQQVLGYVDIRLVAFVVANMVSAPYNFIMQSKVVFRHDDPPTELVERSEDRKSTRLNSSHRLTSRMPSSA
jgi:putative flippase GtrA